MRTRIISTPLKQHFRTAWLCPPQERRGELRRFIRQVREVRRLEGSYIGCPDGTRFGPLGSGQGFTFLYKDDTLAFCDILLEASPDTDPPAETVGLILHELAHARDYLAGPEEMARTAAFAADAGACT